MELFQIGFLKVTIFDLFDIFFISFLIYKLYFFVRDSRAAHMFIGLVLILLLSGLVRLLNMRGMIWIFDSLRTIWLVAFVVLFQPELRRVLLFLGQTPIMRFFVKNNTDKTIDEVHHACLELSKRRYGALIILTQDARIKTIIDTGLRLQADVTAALLISIFNPRSPLHDGAVVVQNNVIEAAKCILPLSQNPDIDPDFGMRHRAALGLSEESDAICLVVSEETGRISIAQKGKFYRDFNYDTLRKYLYDSFKIQPIEKAIN